MTARIALLALAFTGSAAFAIPAFDGTYTCSAEGKTIQLQLTTQDEQLFVSGMDTGMAPNQGLPCANKSESMDANGAKITVTSRCDATTLGMNFVVVQEPSTNLTADISFTKVSDQAVVLGIKVSGIANGQPADANQTVTCTK